MRALARAWLKRRGFGLDIAPALVALGMMFWFGLTPLKSLPGPDFELSDKVWHLVAFGGLAGLLSRAFGYLSHGPSLAAREAALASIALGGLLEALQSLTHYRSADWADLLADTVGAVLAYAVLRSLDRAAAKGSA